MAESTPENQEVLGKKVEDKALDGRYDDLSLKLDGLIGKFDLDDPEARKDLLKHLDRMVESDSDLFVEIASSDLCSPDLLDVFARLSGPISIKRLVAANINTPDYILGSFVYNDDVPVRMNLAANLNTPIDTLALLTYDEDDGVKAKVAGNINTPSELLYALSKSGNPLISDVASNTLDSKFEDSWG